VAIKKAKQTFLLHADFEALLEPAVLALVAMMLVDGAVVVASTRVSQVTTHRPLEEALTSFACQYSVVFTGTSVAAYNTRQTASDDRTAILNTRRIRLEIRSRRPGGYPVCGAERWRTYVVVIIVVIRGSRVGDGSPSRDARTCRRRAYKAARAAIHARPRSTGHLRRRRSHTSDPGNRHRRPARADRK